MSKNIAIFASGRGSNAACIIRYFDKNPGINVALLVTSNAACGAAEAARQKNIPVIALDKKTFHDDTAWASALDEKKSGGGRIDLIVLAGFIWLIPCWLVQLYAGKIINIHPALLPRFGGKGMYGMHVHRAVIDAGEKESGMTIHYVNEKYDDGAIIFQARCPVLPNDSPETLAARVQQLEHRYYAKVIEGMLG